MSLFPGGNRVKKQQRVGTVKGFIGQTDQVCNDFSGIFIVNAPDGFVAGVCDLFCILRKLDLGNEFAGNFILDGSQFVDTAKGRAVFGSDQPGGCGSEEGQEFSDFCGRDQK